MTKEKSKWKVMVVHDWEHPQMIQEQEIKMGQVDLIEELKSMSLEEQVEKPSVSHKIKMKTQTLVRTGENSREFYRFWELQNTWYYTRRRDYTSLNDFAVRLTTIARELGKSDLEVLGAVFLVSVPEEYEFIQNATTVKELLEALVEYDTYQEYQKSEQEEKERKLKRERTQMTEVIEDTTEQLEYMAHDVYNVSEYVKKVKSSIARKWQRLRTAPRSEGLIRKRKSRDTMVYCDQCKRLRQQQPHNPDIEVLSVSSEESEDSSGSGRN